MGRIMRPVVLGSQGPPGRLPTPGATGDFPSTGRPYTLSVEFTADYYLAAIRLIKLGERPLQALQIAARRRGAIVALPEPLAAFLAECTAGEAVALLERAADRAAERDRWKATG